MRQPQGRHAAACSILYLVHSRDKHALPTPVPNTPTHPPTRFTLAARLPGPPGRQRGKRWVQAPTTAQAAPAMPNVLWDGCREAGKGTHGQLGQQVAK